MKDALDVKGMYLVLVEPLPLLLSSSHDIHLVVPYSLLLLNFGDIRFGDLA
jgi:hypothetical protein